MVRPSRNDIRESAHAFAREWEGETSERGEAQTFWTDFLLIFGIERRRVHAAFERHARRTSTGGGGFIDLLWPSMLLAEHKSAGEDLDEAMDQALDYIDSLGDREMPRLVVVSDFARMKVLDLDHDSPEPFEFRLGDLPREIDRFLVLAGYVNRQFEVEDAVNVEAAELLGKVYDEIAATGYAPHALPIFIVRVLFLLFGDNTGLWPRKQFEDVVRNRTAEDGSDLGMWLGRLFTVLDTEDAARTTTLDEDLAAFPFVNGGLYRERIDPPDTTRAMRDQLLDASAFDWSKISPAVFGSMFQSVMDKVARRHLGAHYTSEANIFKVIRPLFLDALEAELEACGSSKARLQNFHTRLGTLTFLDPACGCGNFLVIAYRELRRLERETLLRLPGAIQMTTDLEAWRKVTLDQFHGIEVEEFPVRIAETAMYLVDHLENEALGASFGINIADLPLTESAEIRCANALALPWADVLGPTECSFLLGNPRMVESTCSTMSRRRTWPAFLRATAKAAPWTTWPRGTSSRATILRRASAKQPERSCPQTASHRASRCPPFGPCSTSSACTSHLLGARSTGPAKDADGHTSTSSSSASAIPARPRVALCTSTTQRQAPRSRATCRRSMDTLSRSTRSTQRRGRCRSLPSSPSSTGPSPLTAGTSC
jgi:hypothetical protein